MAAVITVAVVTVIGAGAWFFGWHLSPNSSTSIIQIRWTSFCVGGLIVGLFLAILLHSLHEERVISRTVAATLQGRDSTTDEEFGRRYYANDLAPLAGRLRRILADNLGCDLAGMIPSDDFEKWLYLFPGPDSAADSFFEELAIEFHLTRECSWPEQFGSFDGLVKFVGQHSFGRRARPAQPDSVEA